MKKIIKIEQTLLITIVPIIIGACFTLGLHFGNKKFDNDKNKIAQENFKLKKYKDSIKVIVNEYTQLKNFKDSVENSITDNKKIIDFFLASHVKKQKPKIVYYEQIIEIIKKGFIEKEVSFKGPECIKQTENLFIIRYNIKGTFNDTKQFINENLDFKVNIKNKTIEKTGTISELYDFI